MNQQTASAKTAGLIDPADAGFVIIWRTLIIFGLILLLAVVVLAPLAAPAPKGKNTDAAASSWFHGQWQSSQAFWRKVATKVRWEHLPGLRMTTAKTHALRNEVLRLALIENGWLGKPSGEILFDTQSGKPEAAYSPSVGGLSFRQVNRSDIRELAEEHGQADYVWINDWVPWSGPTLVGLSVGRSVQLSKARTSLKERGCHRWMTIECERTWGDWACLVTNVEGSGCDDVAFDSQRWRSLESLAMNREDQHALWNRVLEHAPDVLDTSSRAITLLSDGLDPKYVPVVDGLSVTLLGRSEIGALRDTHDQAEFVRLRDYYWFRGPLQLLVRIDVGTWEKATTETIRGTPWQGKSSNSRSKSITVKCKRSNTDWSCGR